MSSPWDCVRGPWSWFCRKFRRSSCYTNHQTYHVSILLCAKFADTDLSSMCLNWAAFFATISIRWTFMKHTVYICNTYFLYNLYKCFPTPRGFVVDINAWTVSLDLDLQLARQREMVHFNILDLVRCASSSALRVSCLKLWTNPRWSPDSQWVEQLHQSYNQCVRCGVSRQLFWHHVVALGIFALIARQ